MFGRAQIVYSAYNSKNYGESFNDNFIEKASINNLTEEDLLAYQNGDNVIALDKGAIEYSDAIVQGSETISEATSDLLANTEKPVLDYSEEECRPKLIEFYHSILIEDEEEEEEEVDS